MRMEAWRISSGREYPLSQNRASPITNELISAGDSATSRQRSECIPSSIQCRQDNGYAFNPIGTPPGLLWSERPVGDFLDRRNSRSTYNG